MSHAEMSTNFRAHGHSTQTKTKKKNTPPFWAHTKMSINAKALTLHCKNKGTTRMYTHTHTVHRVIISRAVGSFLGFIMWKPGPWSVSLWTMTWWSEVLEGWGFVPAEWLLLMEDNKQSLSGWSGEHINAAVSHVGPLPELPRSLGRLGDTCQRQTCRNGYVSNSSQSIYWGHVVLSEHSGRAKKKH